MRYGVAPAAVAVLSLWCGCAGGARPGRPGASADASEPRSATGSAPDAALAIHDAGPGAVDAPPLPPVADAALGPPPEEEPPALPGPPPELVTISLVVDPPKRARAIWGAKDLGLAPLEIRRPRGSGPVDLVLRAPGYLPYHTRAFTDRDDKIVIRLVPEAEASRTFGYKPPEPAPPPSRPAPRPRAGGPAVPARVDR